MKNNNNIICLFLIICVFISNISASVSLRFCEGNFKDISFFEVINLDACCDDLCCDNFDTTNNNCCDSKTFIFEKKTFEFYHFGHKNNINFAITSVNYNFIVDNFLIIPSDITLLKNFIQSNAPPIYILLHKLLFYH